MNFVGCDGGKVFHLLNIRRLWSNTCQGFRFLRFITLCLVILIHLLILIQFYWFQSRNCHQLEEQKNWVHSESERFRNEISSDCKKMESVRNVLEFSYANPGRCRYSPLAVSVKQVKLSSESQQLAARIENQFYEIGKMESYPHQSEGHPNDCWQGNGTSATSSLRAPVGLELQKEIESSRQTALKWTREPAFQCSSKDHGTVGYHQHPGTELKIPFFRSGSRQKSRRQSTSNNC